MERYEMKKEAYESNLKNRALQVLLYLIDRSNKEGTCFPAIPTIARELHISVSTVKRAMGELVEAGYIVKESRFRENKGQSSNLYIIAIRKNNKEKIYELTDDKIQRDVLDCKNVKESGVLYSVNNKQCGLKWNSNCQFYEARLNKNIYGYGIDYGYLLLKRWTGEEVNLIPP